MPSPPHTYEDWLLLTEEERDHVHSVLWNAYARTGVAFAFSAAARLAMGSPFGVLNIRIGTYHCGEYLLYLTVSADDFPKCPPPREQRFEGFRVVWMPEQTYATDPDIGAHIEGKWVADESSDDYEFEFRFTAADVNVSGLCRATNSHLLISDSTVNREYVMFSAYNPVLKKHTRHMFHMVAADRCEDSVTKSEYYLRAKLSEVTK
jgi:hypothetical protein